MGRNTLRLLQNWNSLFTPAEQTAIQDVLLRAWTEPFFVSSDFARYNALVVALCASMGMITVVEPTGLRFGRTWHATPWGIHFMEYSRHSQGQ